MEKQISSTAHVIIISLIILLFCYISILFFTDNHFTYSLDDSYIHLKLAQNISLGHYGINLSEYSAPSSSILWPFLLAPFAYFPFFEYVPLFINIICVLCTAAILEKSFHFIPHIKRIILVMTLMFITNIYGVVFTGLEHSLQALLVTIIACYLWCPEEEQNHRKWTLLYISLVMLPLVRYEGLGISLPVLLYLFNRHDKKRSLFCLFCIIFCMLGFSLFLNIHHLGYLPSSIIAKMTSVSPPYTGIEWFLWKNIVLILQNQSIIWLYLVTILLFFCLKKENKHLAYTLLSTILLHHLFGKSGLGRYEIYIVVFMLIILIKNFYKQNKSNINILIFIFIITQNSLYMFTFFTPFASRGIYHQQAQMAIITQMLDEKVGVNDLGLVSFRSKHDVLDLWGLGSINALRLRQLNEGSLTSEWIYDLLKKYDVPYVMIYDDWFKQHNTKELTKVAYLKLTDKRFTILGGDVITLYAINTKYAYKMIEVLKKFEKTSPSPYHKIEFLQ